MEVTKIWFLIFSLYGKTIERTRGRLRAFFVRSYMRFSALKNNPRYRGHLVLAKNMAVVFLMSPKAILKKPIYVGSTILEVILLSM